jgi:pSer/pThr/pTyr-binding forkhead associated (FHA) protein
MQELHGILEGRSEVRLMSSRKFTLGRATTCDIPIADDSVSRVHAEILMLGNDRMLVRDLGSQNGTVLLRQGREFKLGEETIFLTDTLRFGEVTLAARDVFEALSSSAAPRASAPAQVLAPSPAVAPTPVPAQGVVRPPPPQKASSGKSALIRCDCGAIKTRGQRCPVCGE